MTIDIFKEIIDDLDQTYRQKEKTCCGELQPHSYKRFIMFSLFAKYHRVLVIMFKKCSVYVDNAKSHHFNYAAHNDFRANNSEDSIFMDTTSFNNVHLVYFPPRMTSLVQVI